MNELISIDELKELEKQLSGQDFWNLTVRSCINPQIVLCKDVNDPTQDQLLANSYDDISKKNQARLKLIVSANNFLPKLINTAKKYFNIQTLKNVKNQRCEDCNNELSYCGEMGVDGPTLDCRECRSRTLLNCLFQERLD